MTMSISTWAPELLLETFQWLPLRSLITAQGVNCQWRRLVPLADIPPARRALFNLYIDFIGSPSFLPSRHAILTTLRSFDREAYVAFFVDKGLSLPDEFLLWILEWPSKAVFGRSWPGLPPGTLNGLAADPQLFEKIQTIHGFPSKKISERDFETKTEEEYPREVAMQALEIASYGCGVSRWIILDGPRKDLIGTLHCVECCLVDKEHPLPPTWIEWLRREMHYYHGTGPFDK